MKTWKNIFLRIIDKDNIRQAIISASRGKRKRKDVQEVLNNIDFHVDVVHNLLISGGFKPHCNKSCVINEGTVRKVREIHKPDFKYDQIIHHTVMRQLIPYFMNGMYEYVCGSVPGRGAHTGKKYLERCIRNDRKNTKYCCKMDIHHFFASVDHDILKNALAKKIRDNDALELLYGIIDSCEEGLPLGNYTSPWFGNFLLQGLDHYIKECLHIKYYIRYMDDMVIFGHNKKELHKCRAEISEYLKNKLNLTMKNNWQVFRFDYTDADGFSHGRALDFMGFRFFRNRTVLRRGIMLRATGKARRISKKKRITWYDACSMLSYIGWLSCTDSYGLYLKFIKPRVNIGEMKRIVGRHQRWLNYECKMEKNRRLRC